MGQRSGGTELYDAWVDLRVEVARRYNIGDAIRDFTGVTMKRSGQELSSCCPFHEEKSPSFTADNKKGYYKCFGAGCDAKGNVFTLIQEVKGVTFKESVIIAANSCGVPIPDIIQRIDPDGKKAPGQYNGAKSKPVAAPVKRDLAQYDPSDNVVKPSDYVDVPNYFPIPEPGKMFCAWTPKEDAPSGGYVLRCYPKMVHVYRDIDERVVSVVLRHLKRDGKKIFSPLRLGRPADSVSRALKDDNGFGWIVKGGTSGHARPAYGMERARAWARRPAAKRKILIVEGEKTKDAAQRFFDGLPTGEDWLILSGCGGGGSIIYTDWAPLAKLIVDMDEGLPHVVIWPDADPISTNKLTGVQTDPREVFANKGLGSIMKAFIDAGSAPIDKKLYAINPPEGVVKGWDLADAEEELWAPADVLGFMQGNARCVRLDALNLLPSDENHVNVKKELQSPEESEDGTPRI